MPYGPPSLNASGTLFPRRFVSINNSVDGGTNSATDWTATQSVTGQPIYGISQPGTEYGPETAADLGQAATSGKQFQVWGPGESQAWLEVSGLVTAGDYLISDASGRGVSLNLATLTATAIGYYFVGAIAYESQTLSAASGVSSTPIQVIVWPQVIPSPL